MGGSKKQTIGYRYYLGMHLGLCHGPVDKIIRITVDNKTAWAGNSTGGAITFSKEGLFGGESREGGVAGTIDIDLGGPAQTPNSYLVSKLGDLVPAFRGITCAVFRQVYLGMNPYLKQWAFRMQRIHTKAGGEEQWHDDKAEIQHAISSITDGDWQYEVLPYHTDPGYEQLTPPGNWQGTGSLTYIDNNIWLYPTPAGWATPDLSVLWVKKTVYDVPEGLVIKLGADNGCLLWVNGEYVGASNRDNENIAYNHNNPVSFTVPERGTYEILLKAYTESTTAAQSGNVLSVSLENIPPGSDMNPAHIIRECLTDPDWGMGYAAGDVDDDAFEAAADTLYDEGLGISILWDRQVPIEDFIYEIVKHIDGSLYVDRKSGKFVLKLIRDDYVEASLVHLDESSISRVEGFSRPLLGELTNSVTVSYWDMFTGSDASVTVQNTALIQMQGAVIDTTVAYPGFTNAEVASRVASRDLRTMSTPLASCTIYANRDAADLNVGDAFLFSWADYNVSELVMRVGEIAFGDGRSNEIRIRAIQDVFSLPATGEIAVPESRWEDPITAPVAADYTLCVEAPYYELVQTLGQSEADLRITDNEDIGFVAASAVRPSSDSIHAKVYTDAGAGYAEGFGSLDFCPSAQLSADITQTATTIAIASGTDLDLVEIGTHAQVGDELIRIDVVTDSQITVGRGCLDTVPALHSSGDMIFFWGTFSGGDGSEYVDGESVDVKILPVTGQGMVDIDSVTADTVVMDGRAVRPYPPGDLQIDSVSYPTDLIEGTSVTVTWAHRDRLQQTAEIIDHTETDIGPETGTTYTVRVKDFESTLLDDYTLIAGTSQVVTLPSDYGGMDVTIEVVSVRDGYESWQAASVTFQWIGQKTITLKVGEPQETVAVLGYSSTDSADELETPGMTAGDIYVQYEN